MKSSLKFNYYTFVDNQRFILMSENLNSTERSYNMIEIPEWILEDSRKDQRSENKIVSNKIRFKIKLLSICK